jgi:hypothetical protein
MILLPAVAIGLLTGLGWARWRSQPYQPPALRYFWLAFAAFLPQFLAVYLPPLRGQVSERVAALCLLVSQILFLGFVWLNRRLAGVNILMLGLLLNLAVMTTNGGFMPIAPQTASRLVPAQVLANIQSGSRFGIKDILLPPQDTRLEWLADRFLPPAWFPYQAAFSLGDILIAVGAFWLLARQSSSFGITSKGETT